MPVRYSRFFSYCLLFLLAWCLLACDVLSPFSLNTQTTPGTVNNDLPTQYEAQLNVWYKSSTGIELRYESWKSPGNNQDTVTIARFDPHRIHLSVGYQPDKPLSLNDWMKKTKAIAVINGGYFDEENHPTGLLVADGQSYGTSYQGFGGMLSVSTKGKIDLRSLRQQPYDPSSEQLQEAVQSSPMLMLGGKRTTFNDNAVTDRRTVVAIDKQGKLLIIIVPGRSFSLDELADLLASSDLGITIALNLDGGASTGLYLNSGKKNIMIEPITTLPIVLIIK
jgi:exopolysaccharide biosynthesis protein